MKRCAFKLALLLAGFAAGGAHAAITCSLSATAINVIYDGSVGANNNSNGTITLTCDRLSTDASTQTYWIGVLPTAGNPRRLFRHGGGTTTTNRLNTNLYKNGTTTNWADTGTGRVSGTLSFGAALTQSVTLTYDFRIPAGQTGKTAGIYDQAFTAQLELTTAGPVVATANFFPTASVLSQCFVGQVASGNTAQGAVSPTTMTLAYTSFAAAPQTTNMTFTVDCTNSTPYDLDLSPGGGTLLGLNYTVRFDNGLATKTGLVGSGLAQPYTLTATIAAGQAGTCAVATCTATQATTVTISY